jgi:hypothetical protein
VHHPSNSTPLPTVVASSLTLVSPTPVSSHPTESSTIRFHEESGFGMRTDYPTTNVRPVEQRPRQPPELRSGDWYVTDGSGREIARCGDRWSAVRLLGQLAAREHPALPLRVFDAFAHATGDRLG